MANVRLNKQTYSRLSLLEQELYEMAKKVERTIDPKLWAAMASLCSRTYKTDLGEFAKPLGDTKEVLLARYVSGLIILKQPCPNSIQEIDKIRALKQYGHKLVNEFNVSIAEIQQLYNENCGNLPKAGSGSYSGKVSPVGAVVSISELSRHSAPQMSRRKKQYLMNTERFKVKINIQRLLQKT